MEAIKDLIEVFKKHNMSLMFNLDDYSSLGLINLFLIYYKNKDTGSDFISHTMHEGSTINEASLTRFLKVIGKE